MKKIAWPYIGSTEHEMGSMSDAFRDVDQSAYTGYDSLVPEKALHEGVGPTVEYSEGRVSPVDGDGAGVSLSDDPELEDFVDSEDYVSASISNDKFEKSFICNIAKTFQQKVHGLQVYSSLPNNGGLLFPYSKPQDVVYHMGTVSFPIDIIFLDKKGSVKKFYSNIQPGTLGTFGCADVKYVLELAGGQADSLNLNIGDKISLKSHNGSMIKSASLYKENFMQKPNFIHVYSFDSLIDKNSSITINEISSYDEDNISLNLEGEVFTPGKALEVKASELHLYSNFAITKKSAGGLKSFLENTQETYKIYQHLKQAMREDDSIIVFATAYEAAEKVCQAFISKLEILYGKLPSKQPIICKMAKEYNHINLIEDIREIYPKTEIKLVADNNFAKKAGVPIPSSVKQQAKEALKFLEEAEKTMEKSLNNVKQNMTEYEVLRESPDKVKSTKGQYFQSVKRNVGIVKQYLISIRDAIKILNKIKDATTTLQIIEALAEASQDASEYAQEIFDLVEQMDTPDFVMLLTEKTQNYEKGIEDLISTIERAKDYINNDILGIIVISK